MHELSIALAILDVVAEQAGRCDGRVTAVHLKLGPLSGVVREALASAYDLARESSACPGASLVIEEVPVVAYCGGCQTERQVASIQEIRCSVCGQPTPRIVSGRELEVTALEVEDRP